MGSTPVTAPLRMHDTLLINLAGVVALDTSGTREDLAMMVSCIERVLPMVSRDSLLMADLARAAVEIVAAHPPKADPIRWARAHFDMRLALVEILRWRAGQAQAQLYPVEGAR